MIASAQVFTLEDPVFRALLDLAPVAIGVSRRGTMIYGNPVYLRLYGYEKRENLQGRSVMEHIAPSARPEIERRFRRQAGSAQVAEMFEMKGLRRDGMELDLEVTVVPIPLLDGEAALTFLVDISDRKLKDESIWEQETRFKAIFMNAAVGMALVAMDGTPILVNTALVEMLGYSEAELQKMTFGKFTHPEDVQKDVKLFNEIIAGTRATYSLEKRYIRKDGKTFTGFLTVSVVNSPLGKPHYVVGMVEKISARMEKVAV